MKILSFALPVLALALTGAARAQSAVQLAILSRLSRETITVRCAPVAAAGDLKGAVCAEKGGDPLMTTRPDPYRPLEYPTWIEIAPSTYYNIWKSSAARYPVYLSLRPGTDAVTQVTVAAAGAAMPTSARNPGGSRTPATQARAAGATRGAGYTDPRDVRKLAAISTSGQSITLTVGPQKLTFTPGQKAAKLNGKAVTLQANPFRLAGEVYYPVSLFKTLGCMVVPVSNEYGVVAGTDVTCVVGGQPKTVFLIQWTY